MPVHKLREAMARGNALRFYATAWDHWTTEERIMRAEGRLAEAEGAHQYALWIVRAYKAELGERQERAS